MRIALHISFDSQFCVSSTFYSADYKMRLDFSADYDIKCSELEDQSAYDVFVASAQLPSVIDELCSGGKKTPDSCRYTQFPTKALRF